MGIFKKEYIQQRVPEKKNIQKFSQQQVQSQLLQMGSQGAAVSSWQQFMRLKPDGVFGQQTAQATQQWQNQNGLQPDGVVGPATLAVASVLYKYTPQTTTATTPRPTQSPQPTAAGDQKMNDALNQVPNVGSKVDVKPKADSVLRKKIFAQPNVQPNIQNIVNIMQDISATYQQMEQEQVNFTNSSKDHSKNYETSQWGITYAQAFKAWTDSVLNKLNGAGLGSFSPAIKQKIINKVFGVPKQDAQSALQATNVMLKEEPDQFTGMFTQNRGDTENNLKRIIASFTEILNNINSSVRF